MIRIHDGGIVLALMWLAALFGQLLAYCLLTTFPRFELWAGQLLPWVARQLGGSR